MALSVYVENGVLRVNERALPTRNYEYGYVSNNTEINIFESSSREVVLRNFPISDIYKDKAQTVKYSDRDELDAVLAPFLAKDTGTISIVDADTGNSAAVTNNQLHIVGQSYICESNSTETPLGIGGIWTGDAQNILDYNGIALFVTSDVTGTLEVQYSKDGITKWYTSETYNIIAGAEKWFTPPTFGIYFRLKYTNDGTEQTLFEVVTKLSKFPFKWSSHNIDEPIKDEDDAELVKAVITGKKANGEYDNVSLTNGGNAKVSIEEFESGVSTNSNSQLNVSPFTVDEYGNYAHVLGDNIFRGSLVTIPVDHHEIHCGDSYTAHDVEDLTNGASIDYLIIVPDWGAIDGTNPGANQGVKIAHWLIEITGEAETDVLFYESPTVTDNGTALNVLNRNRASNNTDFLAIYQGATVSAVGTELDHERFGSGKALGGSSNRSDEWNLNNNTTYLVRVVNQTTSNNWHSIRFKYYVHPGT